VATFFDQAIKVLTDPLTAEEQESGLYQPAPPPRIVFEGTLEEAEEFFQATTLVENCRNCPIATWTDGLPIVVPTEQRVAEMLTGTSHEPSEQIHQAYESPAGYFGPGAPAGSVVLYADSYTSTVEKVAVTAVMAGCRPEYLPIALAIASSGGGDTNCPGTSSGPGLMFFVSGPIAKEIGMNAGQNSMDVGNYANMTLGRVGALMTVNFGGCITGLVRTDQGGPLHSVCFAEDLEGLPTGWRGYNEESTYIVDGERVNYTEAESVLGKMGPRMMVTGVHFPGSFRVYSLGIGGLARRIGVEGVDGPHNWLEALLPDVATMMGAPGSVTIVMQLNLAQWLYEYGFKDKADAYQWMYETYSITAERYYNYGGWEFPTAGGLAIERTSGLQYKDLPPDYPLQAFTGATFLVSASFADELYWIFAGGPAAYPVDYWR
jgi:hypothetical protein